VADQKERLSARGSHATSQKEMCGPQSKCGTASQAVYCHHISGGGKT